MIIEPLVGVSNPAIILSKVDFPHPDGPTITQKSPSLILIETSFITVDFPKSFFTSFKITSAIFI